MSPLNKDLNPRVKPHPGQGIPNTLLKTQSISKTNTTSIPNTSSIKSINKTNLLLIN